MTPKFETGKALGFALEVFRARQSAFLILALWTAVYGAVMGVLVLQQAGDELAEYVRVSQAFNTSVGRPDANPQAVMEAMGQYLAALLPFLAVGTVAGVILESAWLRLFVRGEGGGPFPFRLGRDEGVFTLTALILTAIVIAAFFLASIVIVLIMTVFALGGSAGAALGGAIGILALFTLMAVVATHLSPVLGLSLLQGKPAIVEGIRGARQMFWPLLGALAVAMLVSFLASLITVGLFGAMPFDQYGRTDGGEPAGTPILFGFYFFAQLVAIIPAALLRGAASYAALQIDAANRPESDAFS